MSDNASSAELAVAKAMANSKMASATDRHLGSLRHEISRDMDAQNQFIQEKNMREAANMEIGRSRNLSRVV
ncbi:MAG: hypothetical protein LBJ61_04885 [Deltaproteobacteria bacterium]|jgi:hypothetical protein|nr:hypothetical protein [Deltaproteobacteria bacterium]